MEDDGEEDEGWRVRRGMRKRKWFKEKGKTLTAQRHLSCWCWAVNICGASGATVCVVCCYVLFVIFLLAPLENAKTDSLLLCDCLKLFQASFEHQQSLLEKCNAEILPEMLRLNVKCVNTK